MEITPEVTTNRNREEQYAIEQQRYVLFIGEFKAF